MPAADPASRGRIRNLDRLRDNGSNGPTKQVTVRDVMQGEELLDLLGELHDQGAGLSISRTRDGGAIAVGFLLGGKPIKRYTPTREAWLGLLEELAG